MGITITEGSNFHPANDDLEFESSDALGSAHLAEYLNGLRANPAAVDFVEEPRLAEEYLIKPRTLKAKWSSLSTRIPWDRMNFHWAQAFDRTGASWSSISQRPFLFSANPAQAYFCEGDSVLNGRAYAIASANGGEAGVHSVTGVMARFFAVFENSTPSTQKVSFEIVSNARLLQLDGGVVTSQPGFARTELEAMGRVKLSVYQSSGGYIPFNVEDSSGRTINVPAGRGGFDDWRYRYAAATASNQFRFSRSIARSNNRYAFDLPPHAKIELWYEVRLICTTEGDWNGIRCRWDETPQLYL